MVRAPSARYWMNGRLVASDRAVLPLTDLAATRGYGAFEALRTYGRAPFLMDAHLRRLEATCRHLCLRVPLSRAELREAVLRTLAANRFAESLIRIYVTGGDAKGFLPEGRERLLILVDPAKTFPAWQYEKGVALRTTVLNRPIPLAKTIDYTAGIRETALAHKAGYQEVVFTDRRGNLLEGTQFSVVAVEGKRLVSPEKDILPGITVEQVLRLARKEGFNLKREPISPALLRRADEVFITSTNREVLPVSRVDKLRIGDGRPGPVARLLHRRYLDGAAAAARKFKPNK